MSANSPTQALDLILHGPARAGNPNIVLLNYSDPATFSALWLNGLESGEVEIDREKVDLTDSTKQFLIIGSDPPDGVFDTKSPALGGINFRSHFTATSWLAAWKVKFPDKAALIAVIDPREANLVSGAARVLQTILAARDANNQSIVPRAAVLNAPGLDDIVGWLGTSRTDTRPTAAHLPDLLKSTIWNGLASDHDRNHALSNVLGSMVLGGQALQGFTEQLPVVSALFSSVGIGITAEEIGGDRIPHEAKCGIGAPILLFDDMSDIWRGPLDRLVSSIKDDDNPLTIVSPTTGNLDSGAIRHLVETLEANLKKPYERRFLKMEDFGVTGEHAGRKDFILFLDLRLFSPSAKPDSEERKLLERLYSAHRRLAEGEKASELPWPGSADSQVLDGLTGDENFSTGYRKARALLPQLISLMDPTLPIVIFSSTQDGDVLREFAAYGNVITAFNKPVFRGPLGDRDEWLTALQMNLAKALAGAAGILRTRRRFLKLEPDRGLAMSTLHPPQENERKASEAPATSVEIYFDESGEAHESPFGVGGVVIISRRQKGFDHRKFAECLEADDRLWGASAECRYRNRSEFPHHYAVKGSKLDTGRGFPPTNDSNDFNAILNRNLLELETFIHDAGGEIYAFSLIAEEQSSEAIFSPEHPHHRYRSLIKDALEVLLYHYAPIVTALEQGARLGIDAATWSPRWSEKWGDLRSAEWDLGIEVRKGDRYAGLRRPDLFPLLVEVINRSGLPCPWQDNIKRARAVQLVDFQRNDVQNGLGIIERCGPRQIHYLADWIVHLATQYNDRREISNMPVLKAWFDQGWIQRYDDGFRSSLKAIREWKQGREQQGLADSENAMRSIRENGILPWSFGNVLAGEFGTWMQRIRGDKLRYLFAAGR